MQPPEEKKIALIVVRTYPTPSKKGVEASCTAAITDKGEWLRLFPVSWRLLPTHQKFQKYQWVQVRVTKASDVRPESYKLKPNGIKILTAPLSSDGEWKARKEIVEPLMSHSLCSLQRQRDANGFPTLGVFRPKSINRLVIRPDAESWSDAQLAILRQQDLFVSLPKHELEKIPFSFLYEFQCEDESCPGHNATCTDWEMAESYRKWKAKYGSGWEEKFRLRYEAQMISKFDTHFFVGTVHQHPSSWIIVGLFYPPHSAKAGSLFEVHC
jgi:hypothetical protein